MNGYLFAAGVTRAQVVCTVGTGRHAGVSNQPHIWEDCSSLIVCADTVDEAQSKFEAWACNQPGREGDNPVKSHVNRIISAQVFEQLLSETGPAPIDWPQIVEQAKADVESIPENDFEQGYWLDVNTLEVPGDTLEAMRQALPEDVRTGLNWSEARQFFFLLSVLNPPPPPVGRDYESETSDTAPAPLPEEGEFVAYGLGVAEQPSDFPQLVEREFVVLIRARNSAVAAWLWRKRAVETSFAMNQIRIDPWCGAVKAETPGEQPA